jgi:hypothetical protein
MSGDEPVHELDRPTRSIHHPRDYLQLNDTGTPTPSM